MSGQRQEDGSSKNSRRSDVCSSGVAHGGAECDQVLRTDQDVLRKIEGEGQVIQGRDCCRDAEIDHDIECHDQDEHLLARANHEQRKELKYEKFAQKPPLTETQSLLHESALCTHCG